MIAWHFPKVSSHSWYYIDTIPNIGLFIMSIKLYIILLTCHIIRFNYFPKIQCTGLNSACLKL